MVNCVVLGTVALDSIQTPFGKVDNSLGGSATYASVAASFFTKPGILSIVGRDFPSTHMKFFKDRGMNTDGIVLGDKTFRWQGYYEFDMNEAKTLRTELNSLETYEVSIPESYKDAKFLFLGNIDPEIQLDVIKSIKNAKLVVMDTMNFWIEHKKDKLLKAIKKCDVLVLNDGEARQLFNTVNLVKAANEALKLASTAVVIKKGEHGSLLFTRDEHFNAPGYPLEDIKDPTGCGDVFGGAFTGYLAKTKDLDEGNMRKAVIYGSVLASFNAEGFGLDRTKKVTHKNIDSRYGVFKNIRKF